MSTLEKLTVQITNALTDLSQINVHTYTGTLVITPGNNVKPEDVLKTAFTNAVTDPSSKIKLAAGTAIKFDGDIDQFFSEGLSADLKEAHLAAVVSSKEYRQGLMNIVTGFVKQD
jgi:hypothetical protein